MVAGRGAMSETQDNYNVLTRPAVLSEHDRICTVYNVSELFAPIEKLRDNWDGYGSLAPSERVLRHAKEVVALLQETILNSGVQWVDPHISANENGHVTLEWWNNEKSLTLFIRSEKQIEYLKAWGMDITFDMQDGEVSPITSFIGHFHWLYAPEKI